MRDWIATANDRYFDVLDAYVEGDKHKTRECIFSVIECLQKQILIDGPVEKNAHMTKCMELLSIAKMIAVDGLNETVESLLGVGVFERLPINTESDKKQVDSGNNDSAPIKSEKVVGSDVYKSEYNRGQEIAREKLQETEKRKQEKAEAEKRKKEKAEAEVASLKDAESIVSTPPITNQSDVGGNNTANVGVPYFDRMKPACLDDYIGQQPVILALKEAISASKKRNAPLDHVLLTGSYGLGKTTLATLIAKEMGCRFVNCVPSVLEKNKDVLNVLRQIQKNDVLFVDEVHGLSEKVLLSFYEAMNDSEFSDVEEIDGRSIVVRKKIPPFTMIAGTTHSGKLANAFVSRFAYKWQLERYSIDELAKMCTVAVSKLGKSISNEDAINIAKRSCGEARRVYQFVKSIDDIAVNQDSKVITEDMIDTAMQRAGVDSIGLTKIQNRILEIIYHQYHGGPVGLNIIANVLGEEADNVKNQYETELLAQGLVRTTARGRVITKLGMQHIGVMDEEGNFIDPNKSDILYEQSDCENSDVAKKTTAEILEDAEIIEGAELQEMPARELDDDVIYISPEDIAINEQIVEDTKDTIANVLQTMKLSGASPEEIGQKAQMMLDSYKEKGVIITLGED